MPHSKEVQIFCSTATPPPDIYTLSLHDALPISAGEAGYPHQRRPGRCAVDHRAPRQRLAARPRAGGQDAGADPAADVRGGGAGGHRQRGHRARHGQGAAQERAREMLRRRRDPQAQAPREAESGQEAHEAARTRRDSAGGVSRGAAGRPQTLRLTIRVAMLQTLMPLIVLLSWLALPVTVVCIVDDWLLRPQRSIAASARTARDAPLMRLLYGALPVLIVAAVLRLLLAERLDFSAVLLAITV